VLGASIAGALTAVSPKATSFSIPGSEVQKAFDLLDERFPGSSSDGATARVVLKAPDGEKLTDAENKAEVQKVVTELKGSSDKIASVSDPYTAQAVSRDGSMAYISVAYKVDTDTLASSAKDALQDVVADARGTGLVAEVGGDAIEEAPGGGGTEAVGVVVAAFVVPVLV
jgi:RND superfamily putative drug exporter